MKGHSTILVVALLLAASMLSATELVPAASSANGNGLHLGFWLQEADIIKGTWQAGYNVGGTNPAKLFFNSMFLTSPYPTSVEVMIFAILQAQTNSQGCTTSSGYIGNSISFWGNLAKLADAYPNIKLVYEIAFDPSSGGSGIYGLTCFDSVVQAFSSYPSIYGLGVEGEYTYGITSAGMQTAMGYVTATGKQFVSYYIHGAAIPQGGYVIAHTNFPGGDAGGSDQVATLGAGGLQTIGLDSGYYFSFPFPGAVTCPIGANAMNSATWGYNQCVVSTEMSTAVGMPVGQRQFLELDPGFSSSGYFTGVSGQSTNQLWDNPTLRNLIWTDPNYQPNFVLSTSSTTTTTSTTSSSSSSSSTSTTTTSSSSSTTTSTTSTTSTSTTSSTSTSSSQTSSQSSTTTSTTNSPPRAYSLSILGDCASTGAGNYPPGSIATVQFAGICNRNSGSGLRVVAWSLDGGSNSPVLTNGTSSMTISMNAPHALRFYTVSQYLLTLDYGAQASLLSITPPTIQGDNFWYDSATLVTFTGGVNFQNYTAASWALDGARPVTVSAGPDFVTSFRMSSQHFLQVLLSPTGASCPSNSCAKPTFDVTIRTNATSPAGAWVDGAFYPRSVTFAWRQGSVHNVTAGAGIKGSSSRTSFVGWTGESKSLTPTVILTVNETGLLNAGYSKQYLVSLSFVDAKGGPLTPQSVTLTTPSGLETLGANLTTWAKSGATYKLSSVMWLNWNVVMSNDSVFKVTQAGALGFVVGVYPQIIKATDAYNLPLQGATVNVTALDGARLFLTTDSQGLAKFRVPMGLYSATIGYLGTSSQVVTGSEGSHSFTVSFLLSYPLLATVCTVSAMLGAFALFRLRKKSTQGIQFFSDQT